MSLYEYTLDAYKHSGEIRIPTYEKEDSNIKAERLKASKGGAE
jgi:hypothetical protein